MRVAFLTPSTDPATGWGNFAVSLVTAINNASNDVAIEIYPSPPFTYSFLNPKKVWTYGRFSIPPDIDIIHASDFPCAVAGAVASRRLRRPLLITLHGSFFAPMRRLDSPIFWWTYRKAKAIVAPSQYTATSAERRFHIDSEKVHVIHNGVDVDRFARPVDTTWLRDRFHRDARIILGVGALKARRGFDVVIRAMKDVIRVVPNAYYVIVGGGDDDGVLRRLASEVGVADHIVFSGHVKDAELPAYFQLCDVYCHTPRHTGWAFEGFGIVYLQAGAAGKPVVASRSGGVPDAVKDGKTGILVPENNPEATAAALIRVLTDSALASHLGVAGKSYAEEHRWESIAREYVSLYKTLL